MGMGFHIDRDFDKFLKNSPLAVKTKAIPDIVSKKTDTKHVVWM